MEMLKGVYKQHLRPRAVVGYGVKIFLPSPPNYVTRSPGCVKTTLTGYKTVGSTKKIKLEEKYLDYNLPVHHQEDAFSH